MEIRRARAADTAAVKGLWAYAFERPGDPFFEWYFSTAYRAEDVLVGEECGRIACDLHLRPYTLSLRGRETAADYIVGVATHPAARGRGMARELIRGAFRASREAGRAVDILMPSDASFYYPMGFAFYAHQWERTASPARLSYLAERPVRAGTIESAADLEMLRSIYDAYTAGRNGFVVRDAASWQRHIEGTLAEGYIAVVFDEEGPSGYLFYTIDDDMLTASEIAFCSEAGRRGIYAYMAGHLGQVETCRWYEPIDDRSYLRWADGAEHTYIKNRTFPYMTARVTDLAAAFEGLETAAEGAVTFLYEDEMLPEESGVYTLAAEGGKLHVTKGGDPAFRLTPGGAAELLFGAAAAEDLFRFRRASWTAGEKKAVLQLMDEMLPVQKNWINEWY